MKARILAGALVALVSTPALANPLLIAGAESFAAQNQKQLQDQGQDQGQAQGQKQTGGNVQNKTDGSVGAALGQAATALSVEGVCGKGTKIAFGALEWSDYSSKCFNYQIALMAAQSGEWELANEWVQRADGM